MPITLQVYLGDIAGSAPGHAIKQFFKIANIAKVTGTFVFLGQMFIL